MCNYTEVLALTVEFLKVLDDTMDRPHQVRCKRYSSRSFNERRLILRAPPMSILFQFFVMTQKTLSTTLWSLVGSKERWTEED